MRRRGSRILGGGSPAAGRCDRLPPPPPHLHAHLHLTSAIPSSCSAPTTTRTTCCTSDRCGCSRRPSSAACSATALPRRRCALPAQHAPRPTPAQPARLNSRPHLSLITPVHAEVASRRRLPSARVRSISRLVLTRERALPTTAARWSARRQARRVRVRRGRSRADGTQWRLEQRERLPALSHSLTRYSLYRYLGVRGWRLR